MKGFKKFVREDGDVNDTLKKIPASHRELVKGYKVVFGPKNTLYGDSGHVGMITNSPKKLITIAAPWRYGREFTVLHEIAHLVYEQWVRGTSFEKEWEAIVKNTKNKKEDESAEELWCHNYANFFTQFKLVIHTHPAWERYLKKFIAFTNTSPK